MEKIYIKKALPPNGHYTPAIKSGAFIFISGQLPINPWTGEKMIGSIEDQTDQVLENIGLLLESANCTKEQVLRTTIYISNIALWDQVNARYGAFFGEHKPVRSIVPTRELHFGFQIEVEAIVEVI